MSSSSCAVPLNKKSSLRKWEDDYTAQHDEDNRSLISRARFAFLSISRSMKIFLHHFFSLSLSFPLNENDLFAKKSGKIPFSAYRLMTIVQCQRVHLLRCLIKRQNQVAIDFHLKNIVTLSFSRCKRLSR